MKKKISIVSDQYYPSSTAQAIRIKYFSEAMANDPNLSVRIFTSKNSRDNGKIKVIKNLISPPSNTSSNSVRLLFEILYGIELFIRLIFYRHDLILITSPPFFVATITSFYCKLFTVKYVIDVRDDYPQVFFTSNVIKENSSLGRLFFEFEKFIFRGAMLIAIVTEGIVKNITQKGFGEKALLIRNGFPADLFSPSAKKYEKFTVVFHGNIGKFQDVGLIMKVAQKVYALTADVKFLVIGEGNNDSIFRASKLPNLTYIDRVSHEKIPEYISKAHLGISFRADNKISHDSFPVKIYEYIGVGIPVIVTPISEAGHFVEKTKIGWQFSSAQEDQIAEAIFRLYSNPQIIEIAKANIINLRDSFSREGNSMMLLGKIKKKL